MRYPISRPFLGARERELLLEVYDSSFVGSGPMVKRFERAFADLLHIEHAVATTSGTTALHLALAALNLDPSDEVIVPDLTYIATANAVRYVGAQPVLVDIEPRTFGLDARLTADAITPRTRAIVPVHLYGLACDLGPLCDLAQRCQLMIIEDAAEGLGGRLDSKHLGTIGDMGCFSFFGNKVMTTGEGGMVVTHDGDLAERLRHLRAMAQSPTHRYFHDELGFNFRMTDLQAALGVGQLERLPESLQKRSAVCRRYRERLCYDVSVPFGRTFTTFAPWLFTCELPVHCRRDAVIARLAERGIDARPTFVPLHRMFGGEDTMFPVATRVGERGLSLPTYPELTLSDVDEISWELIACLT